MRYLNGFLALVLLVLVGIFAFQNRANVDVTFIQWNQSAPLFLVVLASFILGMLFGWGLFGFLRKAVSEVPQYRK